MQARLNYLSNNLVKGDSDKENEDEESTGLFFSFLKKISCDTSALLECESNNHELKKNFDLKKMDYRKCR